MISVASFDLRRGLAAERLEAFSEQSGVQVVFLVEELRGLRTNRLRGRFATSEAMERLLAGTGLVAVRDERADAFVISREGTLAAPNNPQPPPPAMKRNKPAPFLVGFLAVVLSPTLNAQRLGGQTVDEELVRLSPFEVSSSAPARYQAAEAAAGGRIAASIMDTPTTVTVLTRDFINDVGGVRVLDVAKYVAGVSDSTNPNATDSIQIRGFHTHGRRVDGFATDDYANYDHGAIETIEVVKGPDAVLHPSGPPGGTINLVTKKPQFTYGGSVRAQVGRYDTNRAEVDVTGPLSERLAYRLVAAYQDNKGYIQRTFRESFLLSPSLTWRLSPQTSLTLRYEYYDFWTSSLSGLPTDPSVGTNDPFKLVEGVPPNFSPQYGRKYEFRHNMSHSGTFLLTSMITDRLSVRLAGRTAEVTRPVSGTRLGFNAPVGSRNPFTGDWEALTMWTNTSADPANPNWISSPIPRPTMMVQGGTLQGPSMERLRDVQNDYSYIVETDAMRSTSLIGFAYAYEHLQQYRTAITAPPFDWLNFDQSSRPLPVLASAPGSAPYRKASRYQVYATQQLELFEKRLIFSGGVAHITYNGIYGNRLAPETSTSVFGQLYPASHSKATYNYGVVFKPLKNISLYYGHTENAAPPLDFQQVARGIAPAFTVGTQDEVGVKTSLLGGRVLASLVYYEIEQQGYEIYNPGNFVVPVPDPLLPSLFAVRKATGVEFQVAGSITENLSVIANLADTKNRDPGGRLLKSSAEDTWAAFVRYEFTHGALAGFGVSVGVQHMSKRSVEDVSTYSPLSTPDNPIPNQPRAYLPPTTLTDVSLSYRRGSMSYGLRVANVFDKAWFSAGDAPDRVMPGNPLNVSGSVAWEF